MMVSDDIDEQHDIAATPSAGSDSAAEVARWIPQDLRDTYEVHSYRHAASILLNSHEFEFQDIAQALRSFRLTTEDILTGGGNESGIVKRVSGLLRPQGWYETRISADLKVTKETTKKIDRANKLGIIKSESIKERQSVDIPNFVDGHKVDFVKQRIAFDMEWNSKDQTFDRDLYAFRAFYDCSLISAGILLTRSESLNPIFSKLGVKTKYGASTTWMGKLLYRLNAGRNGGCPVLVFGIGDKLVTDWESKL